MILIIVFYKSNEQSLLEFNPFKNQINLKNTSIERFLGDGLELNKETNSSNPLEIKSSFKKKPKHHNLVIVSILESSSNSNSNVLDTILKNKHSNKFDIIVVFSNNTMAESSNYKKLAKYTYINNGSKFQNLHFIYNNHMDVLNKYERFFALDSDIKIDTISINKMFDLSERYTLMISGPTFEHTSNTVMLSKKRTSLRYVNFVECSVPLFNRHSLDKLMKYYDPALMDEGVDYLYIWACGESESNKYAVADNVTCSRTETNGYGEDNTHHSIWDKFAKKWGIKHNKKNHRNWKTVRLK
tara:strand:- start:310 stop:1206 length:897 start_codon:yes stop_codon:yes gene_type:complete